MGNKILIANNRFFPSGGPERYLFQILDALPDAGYSPVPFSMKNKSNLPSPFSESFVDHPLGEDFVLYGDRALSFTEKISLARKVAYDGQVRRAASALIRREKCDLVYGLQIAHYLFPEVVLAAKDCGVPVYLRLSDFQLQCPAYSMFRDGGPCDLCKSGGYWHGFFHRCMKGAGSITAARVAAMYFHRLLGIRNLIDGFICPSVFMADKLIEGGFPKAKIHHLPTPVPGELVSLQPAPLSDKGHILYVGGLYEAKGAQVVVKAAIETGFELVVAGATDTPLGMELKEKAQKRKSANIRFSGFVQGRELAKLYRESLCVVVPSLWYENSPNVALEAMAHQRPVIASDIGSLPETIIDGKTGLLFEPGNEKDLSEKIHRLKSDTATAKAMGQAGREKVLTEHSMTDHLKGLAEIFGGLR